MTAKSFIWPLFLVLGAVFGALHPILIDLGKDKEGKIPFSTASVAFTLESFKLVLALSLLSIESFRPSTSTKPIIALPTKAVFLYTVPALLYTVVNNVGAHAQKHMDPSTFSILNNLKIIMTAVLYKLIIKKDINRQKWYAIMLVFFGGSINSLSGLQNSDRSESETETVDTFVTPTGIVLIMIYCASSSLAGVYTEAVLKKYQQTSINLQNAVLYGFGIIINFTVFVISHDNPSRLINEGFFHGFSIWTWVFILTQAAFGLVISMVMKYLSNIVRVFLLPSSTLVTTILSAIIFGYKPDIFFGIAFILMTYAIYLYNYSTITDTSTDTEKEPIEESKAIDVSVVDV